jgi:hypothetical protein
VKKNYTSFTVGAIVYGWNHSAGCQHYSLSLSSRTKVRLGYETSIYPILFQTIINFSAAHNARICMPSKRRHLLIACVGLTADKTVAHVKLFIDGKRRAAFYFWQTYPPLTCLWSLELLIYSTESMTKIWVIVVEGFHRVVIDSLGGSLMGEFKSTFWKL